MKKFIEVDDRNFKTEVLESELPVLVEFGADWCAPCKRLEPILERYQDEHLGRMRLAHINVDLAANVTAKFQVQSLPTLIMFVQGQPRQASYGMQSPDRIKENFDPLLG
jgi:thioredoxin 1